MTAFDILITVGVLVAFGLIIYLKVTKKTLKELIIETKDLIKAAK